jgi:hypothetical protein
VEEPVVFASVKMKKALAVQRIFAFFGSFIYITPNFVV